MKEFIAALIFVGGGVLAMCVTILFKKNGEFPNSDVGTNPNMKQLGITCARQDDEKYWNKQLKNNSTDCGANFGSDACRDCGFYEAEKRIFRKNNKN